MNSSIINVSEILSSAESIVSAGFSGGYNFDDVNAIEFFDELIENSTYPSPIFSGILIMQKIGNSYAVVDGIQRITTMSLLLCALCESYKNTSKKNDEARNKVLNRFLLNLNEPKLQLQQEDQEIYKKILFSQELSEKESENNLVQTYRSFLGQMQHRKITGTDLFRVISKIEFMFILVNESEISTSDLYQALNKDKSQINLITDFIIKKDKRAASLWLETIKSYNEFGYKGLLESFIKDFLVIQGDGKAPNKNALYNKFKSYYSKISRYRNPKAIIENMCKFAGYYLNIIEADFEDEEVKNQLVILNQNNGRDAYSYLMEVMDDLENNHINLEVFIDILKMINSFVILRQQDPLSDVTVDFSSLSKELNKMLVLKNYAPKILDEDKMSINEIEHAGKIQF